MTNELNAEDQELVQAATGEVLVIKGEVPSDEEIAKIVAEVDAMRIDHEDRSGE